MFEADANVIGNVMSCNSPIFTDWFKRDYIYVDKSRFIKEFMDTDANMLFTRPRLFGKTLNMVLLQQFLCIFEEEPDEKFKALRIFQDVDFVNAHYRKHPVFFMTFLSATSVDLKSMKMWIKHSILRSIYSLTSYLKTPRVDDDPMKKKRHQEITALLNEMEDELKDALDVVTCFLDMMPLVADYFGAQPIVLIDEYDAPIRAASQSGFLEKTLDVMRPLYAGLFKAPHVKACCIGVLRIATKAIFSDQRHLAVCDVNTSDRVADRFSDAFGFTRQEVEALVQRCRENSLPVPTTEQLQSYYDGYTFGRSAHISNPYSVMRALANRELGRYWTAAASKGSFFQLLENCGPDVDLTRLLGPVYQDSGSGEFYIDYTRDTIYGKLFSDADFYKMLYQYGHLTRAIGEDEDKEPAVRPFSLAQKVNLKVSNREVQMNIRSVLFLRLFKLYSTKEFTSLLTRGVENNDLQWAFELVVESTAFVLGPKYFPRGDQMERNYHLAFAILFDCLYRATCSTKTSFRSNRASAGPVSADLAFNVPMADGREALGVLFEFQHTRTKSEMEQRAQEGLHQIIENNYLDHFLQTKTVSKVLLVGVSCHKTKVAFCYQLAARASPSEPWILASSETQCCVLSPEPESHATKE